MMGRAQPRPAIPIEIRLGQEQAANARLVACARTALAAANKALDSHRSNASELVDALLDIHLALAREVSDG